MFGLGIPEILLILAIALIVIGPKKLPEFGKTLGRALREFKKSAQDFKRNLDIDDTLKDVKDIKDLAPTKSNLKGIIKDAVFKEETDSGNQSNAGGYERPQSTAQSNKSPADTNEETGSDDQSYTDQQPYPDPASDPKQTSEDDKNDKPDQPGKTEKAEAIK